jgi:UPF0755 protein
LLLLGAMAAALWARDQFDVIGPAEADVTVVLPHGSGLAELSDALAGAGVIRRALVFQFNVRLEGAAHALKAGEYRFPAHLTGREVMEMLREGSTLVHHLTIPEGLTTAEVLARVAEAPALVGALPPAPGEGTLLPETYNYSWGDSRAALVERMRKAMSETLARLWADRTAGLPYGTPAEALTLASIVEKETAVAAERPRIAGVFVNRLRLNMRLQSDPTVVYALRGGEGALGRELTRADLDVDSPYNTYRFEGLPPGPIDNPGRAALAAAVQPLATKELYFVADGSGGHAFSQTLAEHNKNVERWRKGQ